MNLCRTLTCWLGFISGSTLQSKGVTSNGHLQPKNPKKREDATEKRPAPGGSQTHDYQIYVCALFHCDTAFARQLPVHIASRNALYVWCKTNVLLPLKKKTGLEQKKIGHFKRVRYDYLSNDESSNEMRETSPNSMLFH